MIKELMGLTSVLSIVSISGCSYLSIGEETFSCSGMPDDPKCMNTEDMYYYSLSHESGTNRYNGAAASYPIDYANTRLQAGKDRPKADEGSDITVLDATGKKRKAKVYGSGKEQVIEVEGKILVGDDEIVQNFVTPRLPYSPVPVRSPAMVMRIWVAPYEDRNGDLNAPGYVYTEVEARRWITPSSNTSWQTHFTPLVKSYPSESSVKTVTAPETNSEKKPTKQKQPLMEKH